MSEFLDGGAYIAPFVFLLEKDGGALGTYGFALLSFENILLMPENKLFIILPPALSFFWGLEALFLDIIFISLFSSIIAPLILGADLIGALIVCN